MLVVAFGLICLKSKVLIANFRGVLVIVAARNMLADNYGKVHTGYWNGSACGTQNQVQDVL